MTHLIVQKMEEELLSLKAKSNLRQLPKASHIGKYIEVNGNRMLNLSSNDYLGLASNISLRKEFLESLTPENFLPSASSSRLLTGNFEAYLELEDLLSKLFNTESALVFNSGYHMNIGILPAICNERSLILADKLVHASLIDGIRLSTAQCIRYKHRNMVQLEQLLEKHSNSYEKIIILTESIFSMDGDQIDLSKLVSLKKKYTNVMLYIDEAHGVGVKGKNGLGCAEEQNCIENIDFLVGTFGKALASVGAYLVCKKTIREYLINKMRPLIFTTALPPVNLMWTSFILKRLHTFSNERNLLEKTSNILRNNILKKGFDCPSESQIVPLTTGESKKAVLKAEKLQRKGFYALPVRPPTVPEGTSRIRFSLTASLSEENILSLINEL